MCFFSRIWSPVLGGLFGWLGLLAGGVADCLVPIVCLWTFSLGGLARDGTANCTPFMYPTDVQRLDA